MTKKNYISIITFLVLFTIGFVYLNKVFKSSHYFVNGFENFKKLSKKTNIDVIFLGSSKSYTSFNPAIINDKCKTISYNLGSDSLLLQLTDLLLEEILKFTTPKLIVLEVYPGITNAKITKAIKGHQLRMLDEISNFSLSKYQNISKIFQKKDFLNVYSTTVRNHNKWYNKNYLTAVEPMARTFLLLSGCFTT